MIVIVVGIEDAPRHSSKSFRTFTSKPWIWGFLKYRKPKHCFFPLIKSSDLDDFGVHGYASISDSSKQYHHFRSVCPATIGVPKPMQGRILIATLKIGAAQVGTCSSIPGGNSGCCTFPYISMKFTWYVVSFMIIPMPQQKQKSPLWPLFFRTFLRVYLTGDYYNTVSAFLWTSAMFDSLVKLSACIETVWILKRHRFWCNSLASQLASSKLEIKPTRKSLKSLKIFPDPSQYCKKQKIEILSILASSGLTSSRLYCLCVGTRGCCTSFPAIPTRD